MQLLIILLSLGFRRLWDGANPLQHDGWYWQWLDFLERKELLIGRPLARLLVGIGGPLLALLIVMGLLSAVSYWLLLPLGVVVLLYSLGRQPMPDTVDTYTSACACQNWDFALEQAAALGVDRHCAAENDWDTLHKQVLQAAAYRGFEHSFAVFFWFMILGPAGALLYRLSWLYCDRLGRAATDPDEDHSDAERLLWLLEWPGVRLLGISFAVTGNFVGCFHRWRVCFLCATRSSREVLYQSVLGALLVDDDLRPNPDITRRELAALRGLYNRTFWCWLGVIGIWGILG